MQIRSSHPVESVIGLLPLYICSLSSLLPDTSFIGGALIAAVSAVCALVFFVHRVDAQVLVSAIPFFLLSACYAASLVYAPSYPGLKHFAAVVSVAFLFCFYVKNGWAIRRSPVFVIGAIICSALFFLPTFLSVNAKNYDGGMAFYGSCLAMFLVLHGAPNAKRNQALVAVLGACASLYGLVIGFRMLIVYGILLIVSYAAISCGFPGRRRHGAAFIAIYVALFVFIFFYAHIDQFDYISELNDFLLRTTDRHALSGRETLWPAILRSIVDQPIFGLGAGALPSDILNTDLSSHNYYLQVTLQTGLIGLALSLSAVYMVWRSLMTSSVNSASTAFAASLLVVFIVHNTSEVLMFQNALRISIPAWIVFFIAMSSAEREG